MDLFIQIRNGMPYEHPIMGDNFREAFPDIDPNNLPPEFARFERLECPYAAGPYEVDVVSYQWVDGIVKDVWSVRSMTEEEKAVRKADYSRNLLAVIAAAKDRTQKYIDMAPDEASKNAWLAHLEALNNFVFDDPVLAVLPEPPRVAKDGRLMNLTASGAAPNVTG